MTNNKSKVEINGRELIMERIFDASPELMFDIWSNCNHLKNWWGPKQWPMHECDLNFQVGGNWHFCLRGPNEGDESWGLATYTNIDKPRKIVYQDNFSDKDGNVNKEMPGMLITVEFFEHEGKTRYVGTTLFDTTETLEKIVEMGVVDGMNSSMDRLDDYLRVLAQ
ncbi:MAG: SRPBCC domain-containing protein [Balneolales bacterium]|nr:SRPBCC domain-containing protein [Balneolales bacterium]